MKQRSVLVRRGARASFSDSPSTTWCPEATSALATAALALVRDPVTSTIPPVRFEATVGLRLRPTSTKGRRSESIKPVRVTVVEESKGCTFEPASRISATWQAGRAALTPGCVGDRFTPHPAFDRASETRAQTAQSSAFPPYDSQPLARRRAVRQRGTRPHRSKTRARPPPGEARPPLSSRTSPKKHARTPTGPSMASPTGLALRSARRRGSHSALSARRGLRSGGKSRVQHRSSPMLQSSSSEPSRRVRRRRSVPEPRPRHRQRLRPPLRIPRSEDPPPWGHRPLATRGEAGSPLYGTPRPRSHRPKGCRRTRPSPPPRLVHVPLRPPTRPPERGIHQDRQGRGRGVFGTRCQSCAAFMPTEDLSRSQCHCPPVVPAVPFGHSIRSTTEHRSSWDPTNGGRLALALRLL